MEEKPDNKLMSDYLLGRATAEHRQWIEESYFGDEQFFYELLAVEHALIADYVRGGLPAEERRLFETNYLNTPEKIAELRFVEAFLDGVSAVGQIVPRSIGAASAASPTPFWTLLRERFRTLFWFLTASSAAGLVLLGFFTYRTFYLQGRLQRLQDEQAQVIQEVEREREEVVKQIAQFDAQQSGPNPKPASEMTIRPLLNVQVRGEQPTQVVHIPSGASVLLVQVPVGKGTGQTYQAVVRSDNEEIARVQGVAASTGNARAIFSIPLPVNSLNSRLYVLTITAPPSNEPIALISFEVRKE